jgi:hypothetical protein
MADKKPKVSVKHLMIDKKQSSMLIVIVVATIVTVFCLVATKSLVSKGLYQRRALHARREVDSTLVDNYESAKTLFKQYKLFAEQQPNMLGGLVNGNTNRDGSNPRLVLDALPSTYDAPAVASSIEKVLVGRNITISSLKVTDDPSSNPSKPEANPKTKTIAFSFEGKSNYNNSLQLLKDFERSIRAFDVNTIEISGSDSDLKLTVGMTTYYQPAKSLDLTATQEVK